jgi:DNA replication protein DnaC
VYGYVYDGVESVSGEMGCHACRDDLDRLEIASGFARHRLLEMTRSIGVAPRFAECSFDSFISDGDAMARTVERCKALASGTVSAVALCGPTERGKTHLMVATLKEAVRLSHSALYVSEPVIYRQIRETYLGRKDCMTESQVIARYSDVDVLGIDEIGRSAWTEHETRILGEIITNRHNGMSRTIVATNLNPADFTNYFDDAILRKLTTECLVTAWRRYGHGSGVPRAKEAV